MEWSSGESADGYVNTNVAASLMWHAPEVGRSRYPGRLGSRKIGRDGNISRLRLRRQAIKVV